jgi:hypothetical protein
MILNSNLYSVWEEAIAASFEVTPQHFPEGTE